MLWSCYLIFKWTNRCRISICRYSWGSYYGLADWLTFFVTQNRLFWITKRAPGYGLRLGKQYNNCHRVTNTIQNDFNFSGYLLLLPGIDRGYWLSNKISQTHLVNHNTGYHSNQSESITIFLFYNMICTLLCIQFQLVKWPDLCDDLCYYSAS